MNQLTYDCTNLVDGAATTIVRIPPLRSVEVEQNPQDYSAEAVPSHREPLPQVPVSHSVDVIIDRSYRGLSERSASVPPIPQQEYSYCKHNQRSSR